MEEDCLIPLIGHDHGVRPGDEGMLGNRAYLRIVERDAVTGSTVHITFRRSRSKDIVGL